MLVVVFLIAITQMATQIEGRGLTAITEPITGIVMLAIAAFAPYMVYRVIAFLGFDLYNTMGAEQEAKNAMNRPVPVPTKPTGDGPKKVLDDNGGGGGGGNPPPPPGGGVVGIRHRPRPAEAEALVPGLVRVAVVLRALELLRSACGRRHRRAGCEEGRHRRPRGRQGRRLAGRGRRRRREPEHRQHQQQWQRWESAGVAGASASHPAAERPVRPDAPGPRRRHEAAGRREGVRPVSTKHSTEDTGPGTELVPVKFSRLTRRGILLGLSASQLVTLGIGVLALVGAFYAGGGMLIAYTAPVWVLSAVLTWMPIAGRPVVEWIPVAGWWLWRTTGGQLLYQRRIVAPRPAGTLALPGDMARLREHIDPETGAGMIHDPHQGTLTVVCEIRHPAFVLLDPAEQHRRVTSWGRVLATVCRSGRIATLQVLERTLPDSGAGLAEWWAAHGTQDDSWASTTYQELIDRAGPAGERHATTISLSLDMEAAARQIRTAGGSLRGAAAVLRQR